MGVNAVAKDEARFALRRISEQSTEAAMDPGQVSSSK